MRRILFVAVPLALAAVASAQRALTSPSDGRVQRAVPWRGPAPQRETTAQMMARQAITPPAPPRAILIEKEGPNRENLPQDPRSPEVSSTGFERIVERRSVDRDGGGRGRPGPRFSVPFSFSAASLNDTQSVPPDTQGDVGPQEILVTVNGRFRSFSKTGSLGALNVTADTFFSGQRQGGTTDPRVRYDRLTQRWFIAMIDVGPNGFDMNNRVLVAVSDGPRITGSTVWTKYAVVFSAAVPSTDVGRFLDYPTLGVDKDALYVGGVVFDAGGNYTSCSALVLRKSDILAGSPITVSAFRGLAVVGTNGPFCPQGVSNDDPNSTAGYFAGVSAAASGRLTLRRISDPGGTPTMSGELNITVPTTRRPIDVLVPGGATLDALDDRLFAAKFHADRRTGVRKIYAAHNIEVNAAGVAGGGSRNGSRWYEIDAPYGVEAPTVTRSGTVFDPAATGAQSHWIPDIALNGAGDLIIGNTRGNSTTSPGVAVTYIRRGTATNNTIIAAAGSGTYDTSLFNRWGDYSLTVIDPEDGLTAWTFQERVSGNNNYSVEVVKVLADAPPALNVPTRSSLRRGQTAVFRVTGTGDGVFFDGGATFTKRLSGSLGAGVTVSSLTRISDTEVEVAATAEGAASLGTRMLTIVNPDGQTATRADALTIRGTAPVSGTISTPGFLGAVAGRSFTLNLRDAANANLETLSATTTSDNGLSADSNLPAGTYRLAVQGSGYLRKVVAVTLTDDGLVAPFSLTLVGGDVDGDNQIGTADVSLVAARLGVTSGQPRYLVAADVDGDGTIDADDLAIVRANFRRKGDL